MCHINLKNQTKKIIHKTSVKAFHRTFNSIKNKKTKKQINNFHDITEHNSENVTA